MCYSSALTILWKCFQFRSFSILDQRPQPPVFCADICAKSESNPKCLSKSLDKTKPKKRVFVTKCDSRQYARKCNIAHVATKARNHHISLFWDEIICLIEASKFHGRVCLFTMHVLSLWLKQQYLSALFYFKLTLLAKGADVWQMSVM